MGNTKLASAPNALSDSSERLSGLIVPLAAMPTSVDRRGTYSRSSVEFLLVARDAGFSILHDLPLTPPDENNCPYSSTSSFAVDPQRIDLQKLANVGDISVIELEAYQNVACNPDEDKQKIRSEKNKILRNAYQGFVESGSESRKAEFKKWQEEQSSWLDKFATYEILKTHIKNLKKDEETGEFIEQRWQDWSYGKDFDEKLVSEVKRDFEDEFAAISYIQWIAEKQTLNFKAVAKRLGIEIWGDVPFYTGPADVWANREVFNLDKDGNQLDQGGAPPSDTSKIGQKWGNATYFYNLDNEENRERSEKVIDWWEERIVRAYKLTGGKVRLDHFIGFAEPYIIAANAMTGKEGKKDPSRGLGDALLDRLINKTFQGKICVYPEDLGEMTELTVKLREKYGLMTSKVAGRGLTKHLRRRMRLYKRSQFNPDNYTDNAAAFSSNHDMATLVQSIETVRDKNRFAYWRYVRKLNKQFPDRNINMHTSSTELAEYEMERIMESRAKVAFLAIWDVLHLGEEARYNVPGKVLPENWSWGMTEEQLELFKDEASHWNELNRKVGRLALAA